MKKTRIRRGLFAVGSFDIFLHTISLLINNMNATTFIHCWWHNLGTKIEANRCTNVGHPPIEICNEKQHKSCTAWVRLCDWSETLRARRPREELKSIESWWLILIKYSLQTMRLFIVSTNRNSSTERNMKQKLKGKTNRIACGILTHYSSVSTPILTGTWLHQPSIWLWHSSLDIVKHRGMV